MATSDLARGDRRGNNPDPFGLNFERCGVSVRPDVGLGAIKITIRAEGSRPITVVMAREQAQSLGQLLRLYAVMLDVVDPEGRP
jgi:hypothetical protein